MSAIRLRSRRLAVVGTAVLVLLVLGGATPALREVVHPSGIAILDGTAAISAPLPDDLAMALDRANALSEQYPSDLGFPWVDRDSNQLVIPTTSAQGQSVAADALSTNPIMRLVSSRVESVSHSRQMLQDILDQLIGPNANDVIVTTDYPDPEHDRVILEVSAAPDAFLYGLSQLFDPSAIAVIVVGDQPLTSPA